MRNTVANSLSKISLTRYKQVSILKSVIRKNEYIRRNKKWGTTGGKKLDRNANLISGTVNEIAW